MLRRGGVGAGERDPGETFRRPSSESDAGEGVSEMFRPEEPRRPTS